MSKYTKGDVITTLDELDEQEFIYYRDKVYHAGWWKSWQYRMVVNYLKKGYLYKAIPSTTPKTFTTIHRRVQELEEVVKTLEKEYPNHYIYERSVTTYEDENGNSFYNATFTLKEKTK